MKITTFALAACLLSVSSSAEVVRVEVTSQQDIPEYGYVQMIGKAYFAVDPKDPKNAVVADIDKAPRNADGKVEFTADLLTMWPKVGDGNNVALVDVVNRGSTTAFRLNRTAGQNLVGDGFLLKQGFMIICIGWEFDVASRNGAIRIQVPVATDNGVPITGLVKTAFMPDRRDIVYTMTDMAAYPPVDVNDPTAVLTVRDGLSAKSQTIPRQEWKIAGNVVTLQKGFEPGRNYEISYKAANPPISGLGLIAVRDITAFAKHEAQKRAKYAIGLGVSQSGRFLRTFLYHGMNTDEKGRQVFDGVMAHIAGAARLDVNRRWATPTGLGTYAATGFPFADMAQKDPVSGVTDGLLDNARARTNQPKIFYTNTGVEYRGGGRSAALIHTTADGGKDIALPANVRTYFFAGNQHGPSAFPPPEGQGQQKANPTDYWWNMRALVLAMDRWVREGTQPPPESVSATWERLAREGRDGGVPGDSRRPLADARSPPDCGCPPSLRRDRPARARRCRSSCPRSTPTATSAPASDCRKSPCRSRPTPAGTSATAGLAERISSSRCSVRIFHSRRRRPSARRDTIRVRRSRSATRRATSTWT